LSIFRDVADDVIRGQNYEHIGIGSQEDAAARFLSIEDGGAIKAQHDHAAIEPRIKRQPLGIGERNHSTE